MTNENRATNAHAELSAGKDALRVARACLDIGIVRDAMSRAYYGAFHAARALLLLDGIEPKTHAGVLRMLSEHWVQTGRLEPRFGLALTRLQAYRQAADYAYAFDARLDDVRDELEVVEALLTRAEAAVAAAPRTG
ncbi:MAG: HEPN domain-containing protein [Polyangiaceae bacterium]|nr:HEPN domain-containing protein [Myxococcales bacterium]MCC6903242.1 HEPN domain-containing protein [Polyangiaceae bacterium]